MNAVQTRDLHKYKVLIGDAHQRAGYSLRQLEDITDLNFGYISQIINGRVPPRDTLIVLCAFGWYLTLEETNEILESVGYKVLYTAR